MLGSQARSSSLKHQTRSKRRACVLRGRPSRPRVIQTETCSSAPKHGRKSRIPPAKTSRKIRPIGGGPRSRSGAARRLMKAGGAKRGNEQWKGRLETQTGQAPLTVPDLQILGRGDRSWAPALRVTHPTRIPVRRHGGFPVARTPLLNSDVAWLSSCMGRASANKRDARSPKQLYSARKKLRTTDTASSRKRSSSSSSSWYSSNRKLLY